MKLEVSAQLRQELRLKLAPQIIQSIEILQLPLLELQNKIEQELEENPLLERTDELEESNANESSSDSTNEGTNSDSSVVSEEAIRGNEPATAEGDAQEFSRLDDLGDRWEEQRLTPRRRSSDEPDPKQQALDATPAPPITLEEHLRSQLAFYDISAAVCRAAQAIIANLDRRGYVAYSIEEIQHSIDPPVSFSDLEEALELVQSLEPPGVGARDLSECLLLQLDRKDPDYEFTRQIIADWLDDLMKNRYPLVSRKTGRSVEDIKLAIEKIAELNPMPGALFDEEPAPHVSPDVRVEFIDGRYEIILEDRYIPRINLNNYYLRKLRQTDLDPASREYLQKKLEGARWLLDAIEQRRMTLTRVTTRIVESQKQFLEKGISKLKPLKMQDIADMVGIHVSTVSRAIARKYIDTPQGIYPLKFFFTGGVQKADGKMESWDAVKQKLLDIIDKEDKSKPLSDEEIVEQFQQQGIDIARRTVTKYRKQLAIPSSRGRKQY